MKARYLIPFLFPFLFALPLWATTRTAASCSQITGAYLAGGTAK
jgi:hypothetical protein